MVVQKPDLASVLDHYGVVFDPTRGSQKILCPVHEETVKSCSINLDEQWFNCHACGKKGDSFTLIMEKEGVDFATAVTIAKKIPSYGGDHISGSDDSRVPGVLGRTRPERRDGETRGFRPRFFSSERS